jgi:flagellar hook-associated protein 1 FlgK
VVTAVNEQHMQAFDYNGQQGGRFYEGNSAATIAVSEEVTGNPLRVAAAGLPNAPADGSAALKIAALAGQTRASLHQSIGGAYAVLVGQAGLAAEKSAQMASRQDELMRFLDGRRQEVSGVSLDDEAVRMLGAQRAYQAAARVITAVDQMLDKLINDTGMVGR